MHIALSRDAHAGGAAMIGAAGVGGPVLIMAGGTGGHVFPALAVAKVLRERGVAVVWLGVPAGLESRLVPASGFPIEWVRIAGIRGKGLVTWLLAPLRRVIPPLGMVDVTPIVAWFLLQLVRGYVLRAL